MTALPCLSLLTQPRLKHCTELISQPVLLTFTSWSILCHCTLLPAWPLYLAMLKSTILVLGTSLSDLSHSCQAVFLSQPQMFLLLPYCFHLG